MFSSIKYHYVFDLYIQIFELCYLFDNNGLKNWK
jgi:hypothetical protein